MENLERFRSMVSDFRTSHQKELQKLENVCRMTDYLAGAQLYLRENFLLEEPLCEAHIKERLLGHWGTVPGINLIYSHLNRLIKQEHVEMLLVTGPGHGAPANISNLFLEGSLEEFYPELRPTKEGMAHLIKRFSWPGGFPSHLYPGLPGTIHEGGELGYALATAFGAVMDNPNLVAACIVGDGESETGPTATAWHSIKFLDPAESGAVLPILHLNGYKISNPTIYGTMTHSELQSLFEGYGYEPIMVDGEDLHAEFYLALDYAYEKIRKIQQAARMGERMKRPQWPMIIFKSPKGMTGIKQWHHHPVEGSYRSHQVPIKEVKGDKRAVKTIEHWLRSYAIEELFEGSHVSKEVTGCYATGNLRMGMNPHTFGIKHELKRPDIFEYEVEVSERASSKACHRGEGRTRNVKVSGGYLRDLIKKNPKIVRIFSPDELESNQLGDVFEVTHRNYQWPVHKDDQEHILPEGGRVLEMLSEHTLEAWMQGYVLTGRYGLFPSYESFLDIVGTMMDQYAKFEKFAREIPWRSPTPSLNYLETSTLWRQEHNGFSHQSPGLINRLVNKKASQARVYLPPDANSLVSTLDHCMKSRGYINLIIACKQEMPQWLTMEEAVNHARAGASTWTWASSNDGVDPDVVLVGIGDIPTIEVMAAAQILRQEVPELKVRVVNVCDLFVLQKESDHPHGLDEKMFDSLFTSNRSVIVNFHGYPSVIYQLLYDRNVSERFKINGYREEGTTTTPFDMCVRNKISRYHLIIDALRHASCCNPAVEAKTNELISHYRYVLQSHRLYIEEHGDDPPEIKNWQWCS
ncbi:MAG: Xylulose-5-phosphate phosphoketolase [Chlamydiia bacterium]|nr:Xylulose-5-phosphate phosphoketolase [Chlamydiia bacterium]